MSFICVLSCVVSGGGPVILLIIDSGRLVIWSSDLAQSQYSPYRHVTQGHVGCKFWGESATMGESKCQMKKEGKERKGNERKKERKKEK